MSALPTHVSLYNLPYLVMTWVRLRNVSDTNRLVIHPTAVALDVPNPRAHVGYNSGVMIHTNGPTPKLKNENRKHTN